MVVGVDSGAAKRFFPAGIVHFVITGDAADEEKLMELTLDAGAEDIECEDGYAEIWAEPNALEAISNVLREAGITPDEAEVIQRSDLICEINDLSVANALTRLIDRLEELDDVQQVSHNGNISGELLEQMD